MLEFLLGLALPAGAGKRLTEVVEGQRGVIAVALLVKGVIGGEPVLDGLVEFVIPIQLAQTLSNACGI
jgi:hypothetical protein